VKLAKLRDTPEYKETQEKYGTGSNMQRGIQAATAALQGLAGGNIAGALAGASAPELANIIGHHAGIDDNTAAKAIAHAILGGVTAALQGNSAAAGAAGAASGELVATAIARQLYPDTDPSKLTEDQKQTVSTLASVSAGMAGGIAGGNTADAAAGASAGKISAENNLLGTEIDQVKAAQAHGADVLSCADNPSGEACKRGEAVNKAYAGALATGTVALLPGGAQAMWGLGASANAGISYLADGTIDPTNAVVAGWTNVITMGSGFWSSVGWNAAGGATANWINGDNPVSGAITNGIGAGFGYVVGSGISLSTGKVTNAVGKWVTDGWDPKYDPTWIKYTEVNRNSIIREELKPSNIPSSAGDVGGSIGSEIGGKVTEKGLGLLEDQKK